MFRLNLKIAMRNLWKNKGYTLINILGLSIGLAVFCVILLFVNHETSYDRFDQAMDRVYRLGYHKGEKKSDYFSYMDAGLIKSNEPAVEDFTVIESPRNDQEMLVESNQQAFYLNKIIRADANFFKFFPFVLLEGTKHTVFSNTNSIVLSKALTEKLFSGKEAIGQTLKTKDIFNQTTTYTVTGVLDEQKSASHLDMNACVYTAKSDFQKTEGYGVYNIYFRLKPGADLASVDKTVNRLISGKWAKKAGLAAVGKSASSESRLGTSASKEKSLPEGAFLEKAQDIHLHPKMDVGSNLQVINILGFLAIFILVLVGINFTNLLVARSFKRAKEVGIRKVLGAQVPAIMTQFIVEVMVQIFAAFLIGMVLMEFMLPIFNGMLDLSLTFWTNPSISGILTQIGLVLLGTLLFTGAYPAWYLSRFEPAKVLKGDISRSQGGNRLRNGLLILQFAISVIFLAGMLLVKEQVNFIRKQDPGFNAAQVLAIKAQTTPTAYENYNRLKSRLEAVPGVALVSKTTFLPGAQLPITLGLNHNGNIVQTKKIAASIGYFDVMNIPILQGRAYTGKFSSDTTDAIVLNEAAVKALGITDPIGKTVSFENNKYDKYTTRKIIGVVKDVNMQGFEVGVAPAFYVPDLMMGGGWQNQILLRLKEGEIQKTMAAVKNIWAEIEPGYPMSYVFVDEQFNLSYGKYIRLSELFSAFTFLSVFITIMGLLALVALMSAQRTKEIGIRKVLGASELNIIMMLNKSFVKLVFIGNILALPVVYILMKSWLDSFAYRMEMPVWPYLLAVLTSILLAILTVSMQTFKTARKNPVEALKYE